MESRFSINENLLQVNMIESSIVSQRLAYEGIHRGGGILEVKVTPELQKCVKSSYRTYKAAREEARQRENNTKKERAEKRLATIKLNDAFAKKKVCLSEMKSNKQQIDAEINKLNKQLWK